MVMQACIIIYGKTTPHARVVELVDARDLKSLGRDTVWVRFPSLAPNRHHIVEEPKKNAPSHLQLWHMILYGASYLGVAQLVAH